MSLIKTEVRDKTGLPRKDGVIQGSLCLSCFEDRIGRKLKPSDIEPGYKWWLADRPVSSRLCDRLLTLLTRTARR